MTKAMAEKLERKAEKLAKGHGGDLPNPCLKESGYCGLVAIKKTADGWVKIAEELAKEHSGVLPSQAWLREHGYGGLVAIMSKHPRLFAHS